MHKMKKKVIYPAKSLSLIILFLIGLSMLFISSCKEDENLSDPTDKTCLLTKQKTEDGAVLASYTYDLEGRLVQVDYGENSNAYYTVSYAGETATIVRYGEAGTMTTNCSLNANGYVEESLNSEGIRSTYSYSGEGYLLRAETRNAEDSLLSTTDFVVADSNLVEKVIRKYGAAPDVITCTYTYYPDITDRNGVYHFIQEDETPFSHPPIYGKPFTNLPMTKTLVSENDPGLNYEKEYLYEICRIGNMLGREILSDAAAPLVNRFSYDCE
jgi:hypothetical protein